MREPNDGAPTPTVPEPTPLPNTSPFDELSRWESALFPFAVAYPTPFDNILGPDECPEQFYQACFVEVTQ